MFAIKIVQASIIFFIIQSPLLAQTPDLEKFYALMRRGEFNRAKKLLDSLPQDASVLGALGKYYLAKKELSQSISYFERSLHSTPDYHDILVDFGRALWLKGERDKQLKVDLEGIVFPKEFQKLDESSQNRAIGLWQKALPSSKPSERARASLYLAAADLRYLGLAERAVTRLPDNSHKVPFLLNLYSISGHKKWLALALPLADNLRDKSWVEYKLGNLETALAQAISIPAPDLSWRYEWELGRISPPGKRQQRYFQQAVATADLLKRRINLPIEDLNLLYREAATNLLEAGEVSQGLDVLQSFNINQLEKFFQDNCFQTYSKSPSENARVAKVTTLVSNERVYVVVSRAGKNKLVKISMPRSKLLALIKNLRISLQDIAINRYITFASELYATLIKPAQPELQGADRLIFVNDPLLSSIPYSVLFDGKRYLIERYAISYSAGIDANSLNDPTNRASTLAVAIDDPPSPWSPLPYASNEVKSISDKSYTNLSFRDFKSKVARGNFSTIHLATHARIAVDIEQSKIVFADGNVTIADLVKTLPPSVSLLVLSACQTGIGGGTGSVFGLAGIALKSNVKQVLASLWAVNDAETGKLMKQFYKNKLSGLSEARSLQIAQVSFIKSPNFHPYTWSSFILVEK